MDNADISSTLKSERAKTFNEAADLFAGKGRISWSTGDIVSILRARAKEESICKKGDDNEKSILP